MKLTRLLLICVLGFWSCGSDSNDTPDIPQSVTMTVTPETLSFPYTADNQTMTVTVDANWNISSSESWCKVSPSGGLKGAATTVTVKVEKNSGTEARTATLTLKAGDTSRQYTITQAYDIKEVVFADAAFEAYCVGAFDTDNDGKISDAETAAVKVVSVPSKGIASLEGMERFTNLTDLNCKGNSLKTLDVSPFKALQSLNCADNQLSELSIRTNINLKSLDCTGNAALKEVLVWTGFTATDDYKIPAGASFVEPEIETPLGYTLVFQDEFNTPRTADGKGTLPDTNNWWYETADPGWVNNELQRYVAGVIGTDTTAVVSDGTLKIIAKKRGSEVVSARLNTNGGWTYGYFEARLKLPQGKGTWPAFWMMPKNFTAWPDDGEIDIMEEVGCDPNQVSSSIHCKAYYHSIGTQKTASRYLEGAESEFHVYALEWTEDFIRSYVDGKQLFEFKNDKAGNKDTWPFYTPFGLKLNLAWGGDWGGYKGVDESALPCTFEIDYVRVFQK